MQTFAQFKSKLRRRLWPAGEPANLVVSHDAFFQNAMLYLQQWVPCLKEYNTSTYETAAREWDNAKTRVPMPNGVIRKVYTVAGGTDRWRDQVFYSSSNARELDCWTRNLVDARTPTGLPDLGFGVRKEEVASDWAQGRARIGAWAHYRGKLYVAPWLQTYEMLVVEWDGEKTEWQESDGVDPELWRADAEKAVEEYVQWRHEKRFGDLGVAREIKVDFDKSLAELMHWCREKTRQREDEFCASRGGTMDPVPSSGVGGEGGDLDDDDDDPTTPDTTEEDAVLFDFVGDVEITSEGQALAASIESDNPEFLVVGGDIGYASDNGGYAAAFGADAMYGWAKDAGIVIPVVGNHEYDGDADLSEYLAYFDDEIGNNGRYYEFTHGSVHGICENRNSEETDGFNTTSIQNEYIFAKMFLSSARWKFCFGHQPPFSSGTTYGNNAALQRNYAGMGVHAVFSAHEHNAEHIVRDGVHYFNCGLGGRSLYPFGSAISGSQFRYNAKATRLRVRLDCDQCTVEFVNVDNEIVYSVTIEHPDA